MTDKAVHARADGKAKTATSVVWELKVGPVAMRCRRISETASIMEIRDADGWARVRTEGAPADLLLRLVTTPRLLGHVTAATLAAKPKP